MSRYIDAEAFYEALRKETAGYSKQEQRSGEDYSWIWRKEFYHVFNNFPAADVAEVRHGRWNRNDNGTYSCNRCHSWIPEEQHYYARYCLHCGAKMDEVGE